MPSAARASFKVFATNARKSLRQHRTGLEVIPFPRLGPEALRGQAARRHHHVAMKIPLIAVLAGPVDREIRPGLVGVGQVPGNDPRGLKTPRLRQLGRIAEHQFAGGLRVGLELPGPRPALAVALAQLGRIPQPGVGPHAGASSGTTISEASRPFLRV